MDDIRLVVDRRSKRAKYHNSLNTLVKNMTQPVSLGGRIRIIFSDVVKQTYVYISEANYFFQFNYYICTNKAIFNEYVCTKMDIFSIQHITDTDYISSL